MPCRFHLKISFPEAAGLQNFKNVHGDVVARLSRLLLPVRKISRVNRVLTIYTLLR